eukprot:10570439-Lingulodinium_polyedra.AAC.1
MGPLLRHPGCWPGCAAPLVVALAAAPRSPNWRPQELRLLTAYLPGHRLAQLLGLSAPPEG